jgi:organic hydroperoxide reductase OsmC/OhrA
VKISARIQSSYGEHQATLTTNGDSHSIAIPPKTAGFGSSANGGELLLLALATCYGNDIYREAAKRGITVEQVEVEAEGQFGADGESATHVTYRAKVVAQADESEIRELMLHTDTLAEIQNTLRNRTPVTLSHIEAISVQT